MSKQSVKELGKVLPEHIRLLSRLIARKPPTYTAEWASSIEQAFNLYTNTRTVNLFQSMNQLLIEYEWPFPAYIDLRAELHRIELDGVDLMKRPRWLKFRTLLGQANIVSLLLSAAFDPAVKERIDKVMKNLFDRQATAIFRELATSETLRQKERIILELRQAYRRKMWATCITTAMPLLDFLMRAYFETKKINVTIQVLRDAFIREAELKPKDLTPGTAFLHGQPLSKSIEEDLRLPGIYLSSFFEFADRYYEWYKSSEASPRTPLNRHAIMHCSSEYWTHANAVRILTFLDLTVRLAPALKILIRGEGALPIEPA
jgi:hypothetical protein